MERRPGETGDRHKGEEGAVATAKHPRFDRHYDELGYQPMLEVLAYMRANGFKTFIVSGGGIEFMRAFAEKRYAIPPDQLVGSSIVTKFERRDGRPTLFRLSLVNFFDDGTGKPVGTISTSASGNSDGDREIAAMDHRGGQAQPWALGASDRCEA